MKRKSYKINRKHIMKSFLLYLIFLFITISSILKYINASFAEKLKIMSIFYTIDSVPVMVLPGILAFLLNLVMEIKCFLYTKNVLVINSQEIIYTPPYLKKIAINTSKINKIYVTGHNIAVQLKEPVEVNSNLYVMLFKKESLIQCIYIDYEELDCTLDMLKSDIKEILNIEIQDISKKK